MKKILQLSFVPTSTDLGLLILRLWFGVSMAFLHGWPKLSGFSGMADGFPDPLGVGARNSLILAIVGELVCSLLLVLGLFTRIAALGAAITMGIAYGIIHKWALSGPQSGEMAYLYLGVFVVLFITGAGRFSVDGSGGGSPAPRAAKPRRE